MKNLQWSFASTEGGQEDGINNPLLEHFIGDINYYLAREVIQNSLDARKNLDTPVKVDFSLNNLAINNFPDIQEFKNILKKCERYWPNEDEETQSFISNGLNLLNQNYIKVLKISDYNTVGLDGSDSDVGETWYKLTKSTGSSSKKKGQGGSKGIGKGAPLAASQIRTVIYSSISDKDGRSRFKGLTELVCFESDGKVMRGKGSYCYPKQETVFNSIDIPSEFRRKEKGLDIYVFGYKSEIGWDDKLIESVLRNFWYAIEVNDLVVSVNNTNISKNNLSDLLSNYFGDKPVKDFVEPYGNPKYYYQAFKNYDKKFEDTLPILGKVKFFFKKIEQPLNYIAMLRAPHMVIYSKQFIFPAAYAGVFVCDDKNGNEQLRLMEPPAHDKWDPERNKENGISVMEELTNWLRSCIREMKEIRLGEKLGVPEMEKYLPYLEDIDEDSNKGDLNSNERDDNENESAKEHQKNEIFELSSVIEPYKVSVLNRQTSGYGGKGTIIRGSNIKGKKGKKALGGGNGKKKAFDPNEINARIFNIPSKRENLTYKVILRPSITDNCDLKINAVGEEGAAERIKILSIKDSRGINFHCSNNVIHKFQLENNRVIELEIILATRIKTSLIIEAYAI
jgi:hypothetical protein